LNTNVEVRAWIENESESENYYASERNF